MDKLILSFSLALLLFSRNAAFAADGGMKKGETIESYLQSLSTLPDVVQRRDPFEIPPSPFQAKPMAKEVDFDPNAPILQRYPTQQYSIVAVLLGDVYPRALVRPPGENKSVLIVREKDKLGNRGGIIDRITHDGLAVLQKRRDASGYVEKAEIILHVGEKAGAGADAAAGGKSGT